MITNDAPQAIDYILNREDWDITLCEAVSEDQAVLDVLHAIARGQWEDSYKDDIMNGLRKYALETAEYEGMYNPYYEPEVEAEYEPEVRRSETYCYGNSDYHDVQLVKSVLVQEGWAATSINEQVDGFYSFDYWEGA